MPEDLWVDDDLITEDRLNNIERSLIIICTSTTRPTDPTPGMTIFETDTQQQLQWITDTVGWAKQWRSAWGVLGQGANTDQWPALSGSEIIVAANGLTIPQNRLLNVHWEVTYVASGGASGASPRFTVQVDVGSGLNDIGDPGTAGVSPYVLDGVPVDASYHPAGKTVSYVSGAEGTFSFALKAEAVGGTNIDIRGDIAVTRLEVMDVGAWDDPAP